MDPPPISATSAAETVDSFPRPANAKIRLLCSYGGHIIPRPHDKSLCYAGGDTRIVAIDHRTTAATLSHFVAHLSRTLYNNRPFTLKFQLPNEDLDSLISVTTDEDLHNMLEEHDRIACSPMPARIRLFLFPSKPESVVSALLDPKAESWFCDALKSTNIMQRGQSDDSGLVNSLMSLNCGAPSADPSLEAQIESLSNSGEVKHGQVPESIVLETSSSFGSTSSSISMSNLPPIGVHGDDIGAVKMLKLPSSGSMESDNSTPSAITFQHAPIYQDPVIHLPSVDTKVLSGAVDSGNFAHNPASGVQVLKTVQVGAHQVSLQSDQIQQQQDIRYIQAGSHYIPQYSAGPLPAPSYHPMYYSHLYQQTHSPYQPNQPYPVYFLPVRPTQSYNMSTPYNVADTPTAAQTQPRSHPPATIITPSVAYKEVVTATPLIQVSSHQQQQQLVDLSEMNHTTQSTATSEFEDDFAYTQIYKTQPSGPAFISQFQTMTNAGTILLSDASNQPLADNIK